MRNPASAARQFRSNLFEGLFPSEQIASSGYLKTFIASILKVAKRIPIDPFFLILALCPVFVLLRDSNPIFTRVGMIDPWVYYGYFHNLVPFKRDLFPLTYYGSRLSWLLPGYLLNKVFAPVLANYVLHLSVYYTALFSLFSLLKTATTRQAALFGSLLLGFYPYFWLAAGWDYADGAGIAWFLLAMVLLTRASTVRRQRGSLIGAGAVCAALIYSNLVWCIFCPLLAIYYVSCNKIRRKVTLIAGILEMAVWFGAGIVTVTAILGLVNHLLDGNYWFYRPSIQYAQYLGKIVNPWRLPFAAWIPTARWIALPEATVMATLATIAFRWQELFKLRNIASVFFLFQFLMAGGLMIWMEFRGNPLLQFYYYASYLIPFMFLAIGTQCFKVPQLSAVQFSLIVAFTLIVFGLPWWGFTDRSWASLSTRLWPFWIALLVVSVGAMLYGRALGLIAVLASAGILYSNLHYIVGEVQAPNAARGSVERIAYAIHEIEKVRQSLPIHPVRFWYDSRAAFGPELYSLNSTYLWGYTMITDKFPTLRRDLVPLGSLVVVASNRDDAVEEAEESFSGDGERLRFLSEAPIPDTAPAYTLSFFQSEKDQGEPHELSVVFDEEGNGSLLTPGDGIAKALPLDRWKLWGSSTTEGLITRERDGLHVKTPSGGSAYATVYPPLIISSPGTYRFELKYKMLSGHMYFGILNGDRSSWLAGVTERSDSNQHGSVKCSVTLHAQDKIWLITANAQPTQVASTYIVQEVRAFQGNEE